MNPVTIQFLYTIEEAFLFSLVTVGVFISFRLLKFPDLTAEGGFGLAAFFSGVVLIKTGSTAMSILFGVFCGAMCGLTTAILTNIIKLPAILASILTMIMSVSFVLLVAGQPSITLPDIWILKKIIPLDSPVWIGVVGGAIVLFITMMLLYVVYHSGVGFLLRTRGENPRLLQDLGRSLLCWDVVGLCLANGIIGFAAALFAQRSGYASINMGRGVAIAALAAIMLGESFFKSQSLRQAFFACFIGTVILRLVRLLALFLGMPEGSLDLVTSLMVVVFYYIAKKRPEKSYGVLENIRV